MANTTNLNLSKLSGTEKLKTFPTPYSDNMDAIDGAFGAGFGVSGKPTVNAEINSLADGLAIISNGNTHAAITAGQFVYVRGHGSLPNGLYVATANIAENGTLSGSNLTADSSGGLNTVYSTINSMIGTVPSGQTVEGQIDSLNSNTVKNTDRVLIDRNTSSSLSNCDTITEPGMYRIINSTANKPSNINYGTLIYLRSFDYHAQLAISTSGVFAVRGKGTGDTWGTWNTVTTT